MKTILLALVTAFAVASTGEAQVLSGSGTAVIDGFIDNDEWANSAARLISVNKPGGGTVSGGLFVMNDATNLYLGLVVVYLDDLIDLGVYLDANGDGDTHGVGDESIGYTSTGVARDNYSTATLNDFDTNDGGTLDVIGATSTTSISRHIEVSHPLNGGDVGHDIAVGPDDLVAFYAQIRLFPGSVDSYFPGPVAGIEAEVQIVPEPAAAAGAAVVMLGLVLLRARRRH